MKATKKIVGAAVALVAAVALSAGSTFAWFASNDTVTATNMEVKAKVPDNIYIAAGYESQMSAINGVTISMESVSVTLNPVAVSAATASGTTLQTGETAYTGSEPANYDGKIYLYDATFGAENKPTADSSGTPEGYTLKATGTPDFGTDEQADGDGKFEWGESDGEATTAAQYVGDYQMTIANKGNQLDLDATVTVTWDESAEDFNLYKFLRVGFDIHYNDKNTFISLANDGTTGKGEASGQSMTFSYSKLIESFTGDSKAFITFLAWFDGNDADCKVNNALKTDAFKITVEYTRNAGE